MLDPASAFDPLKAYTERPDDIGKRFWCQSLGAWCVIIKNLGATDIAAKNACIASTTDSTSGGARISGTGGAEGNFAGIRPLAADSIAQNEYGAIIVAGPASVVCNGTALVAEKPVITGTTAGGVQRAPSGTPADLAAVDTRTIALNNIIGYAQATVADTATGIINIRNGASVY